MGLLKTAFLTCALAAITAVVLLFIDVFVGEAPAEVAGTAGMVGGTATVLRPAMPLEYAWILLVVAIVIAGVHALFKHRASQGQV